MHSILDSGSWILFSLSFWDLGFWIFIVVLNNADSSGIFIMVARGGDGVRQ
jgi:hypothetical protein